MRFWTCFLLLCFTVVSPLTAGASERIVGLGARTGLEVTVYNADLAQVRDIRRVLLEKGESRIVFSDVSARLQPETATVSGQGIGVMEQGFETKPISPQTLLAASVGRELELVRINPATGEETVRRARLLAVANGPVLEIDGKVRTGWPGSYLFDAVPPGLRPKPALILRLKSADAGERVLDLTYLTSGLSWQADTVAVMGPKGDMGLDVRATLRNGSGADYRNTSLKLVAGDVNTVQSRRTLRAAAPMLEATMADGVAEQAVSGYHVYSLARSVTLKDGETKQVSLFSAPSVAVTRELVAQGNGQMFHGRRREEAESNAAIELVMENTRDAGLGMALPAGAVRVYRKDAAGGLIYLGADHLTHTAIGKTVRLGVGRDFDVPVKRVQTAFTRVADRLHEAAVRVTVSNGGADEVTVTVREPIPGDWKMLDESHPHDKVSANRAEWRLTVPAKGETVLTYRVRVRF